MKAVRSLRLMLCDLIHNQRLARKLGYHLTARELDVLEFMTKAMKNLEIADHHSVCRETDNAHVGSICRS